MRFIILDIVAIFFYFLAAAWQGLHLLGRRREGKFGLLILGSLAVLLHAYLLYRWIDLSGVGQNLSFLNLTSMVVWLAALLVLLATITMPVENLIVLIFPIAAFSIALVVLFPMRNLINTGTEPRKLFHILLSLLAFSVLWVASMQAILLAIQDRQLRKKQTRGIIQFLPPLQTMESLLFKIIWLGFILLSLVLITAFLFFDNILAPDLLRHTVLSCIAWVIFAILLLGRHYFGWRGRKAINWTLGGVLFLALSYLGSHYLLALVG